MPTLSLNRLGGNDVKNMNIEEFYKEFSHEVLLKSGSEENFTRSSFVETMCELLEEEGLLSDYELTLYKNTPKGLALDAYSFDFELGTIKFILADYRDTEDLETLTNSEIKKSTNKVKKFFEACRKEEFCRALDEARPETPLAWEINALKAGDWKLSFVIISNAQLSSRISKIDSPEISGFDTSCDCWDLERVCKSRTSGKAKEDLILKFEDENSTGLPCLLASSYKENSNSYLFVLPGNLLADLYEKYGERLLEQNVRTFLQFRGKINKGMRNTIVQEPDMFFAFNNGLSATAEEVVTNEGKSKIKSIKNLQIVNGGQTTASIFTTRKKDKADLSKVFVQVKLTVVETEEVEMVVPRISEYANTQNKVNAADFFSNHPFHLRIEDFSRKILAPSPNSGLRGTRWFYERARGQYANQQANLSPAQKKKFLLEHPRAQMLTKTDLAKYFLTFEELPQIVSLGAQKAFAGSTRNKGFVGLIKKIWDDSEGEINDLWFKRIIAKAIMFRGLDKLIMSQSWYAGGYKANIVTYSIAKFSSIVRLQDEKVDFMKFWEQQALPKELAAFLLVIAEQVNESLMNPPTGMPTNITEWAKRDQCWKVIEELSFDLPEPIKSFLISPEKSIEREKEGVRNQNIQSNINQQAYVLEKGADYWKALKSWNNNEKKLTAKEIGILNIACTIPNRFPTEKQAPILVEAERRAKVEGFYVNS